MEGEGHRENARLRSGVEFLVSASLVVVRCRPSCVATPCATGLAVFKKLRFESDQGSYFDVFSTLFFLSFDRLLSFVRTCVLLLVARYPSVPVLSCAIHSSLLSSPNHAVHPK